MTDDGVVRLRMLGSCDGCPSSSVTLTLAVEDAVQAAAPEVTGIEVEEPGRRTAAAVIPVSALRAAAGRAPRRRPAVVGTGAGAGRAGLRAGRRASRSPGCRSWPRVGSDLYAYRDRCPAAAAASPTAPSSAASAAAPATRCCAARAAAAHYDVRRAGRGLDDTDDHLDPLPLLVRDGVADGGRPGRR